MFEFAPNPSGPAHLGTLRTYAVAYLQARQSHQPVFIRFDAWDYYDPMLRQWADQFLKELQELDLSPDLWQYCTQPPVLPCVPTWALAVQNKDGRYACYPHLKNDVEIVDDRPENWQAGGSIPLRSFQPGSIDADLYSLFAVWRQGFEHYEILAGLAALINMNLRGTGTIVRAHHIACIREFQESPAAERFGLHLPSIKYTGVVVGEKGALKKSHFKPGETGTIAWAIGKYGASQTREAVLRSAREDERPAISLQDILS